MISILYFNDWFILVRTNKDLYKIGICYQEQLVDLLPVDKYDIKMDMVITD